MQSGVATRSFIAIALVLGAIYVAGLVCAFLIDTGVGGALMFTAAIGLLVLHSRWRPSMWIGPLIGAGALSIPVLQANDFGIGRGDPVEFVLFILVWALVGGILGLVINWSESSPRPRLKRSVRIASWVVLAGGVAIVAITSWDYVADSLPGRLGKSLELRLVSEVGDAALTQEVVDDAIETGEAPLGYVWVRVTKEKGEELFGSFDDWEFPAPQTDRGIIRSVVPEENAESIQHYVLMADEFPHALTHDARHGEWGLKSIKRVSDRDRRPDSVCIGVAMHFDKRAAELVGETSQACMGRQLGFVIDGWLHAAPNVNSRFTASSEIIRTLSTSGRDAATDAEIAEAESWPEELHALLTDPDHE